MGESVRAVWSFWSKPFYANRNIQWSAPLHHLLAWGLSLRAASRHYPETALVTDRAGKRLLIDQLGLPFAHVSTELERLAHLDPGWWAMGKLFAYSLQEKPFVHIDTDIFLWKPLPRALVESPVFSQCPEIYANDSKPSLREIEWAFGEAGTELPAEWRWVRSRGATHFREENCGILGGTNVAFLRHYAQTALDMVMRPENEPAWSRLPDKFSHNFSIEQFLLAACIDFHRHGHEPKFSGIEVRNLFSNVAEAGDPSRAARLGYTHLLGGAKAHPAVARRIEERARREDPAYFRRCEQLLRRSA